MKVVTFVGTRPEIIKLSAVLRKLDEFFNHTLIHTGQHYDHELNGVFFSDLDLRPPDEFLSASRESPAACIADVIRLSDSALDRINPDAILIYGDTNSALCAYSAKRRRIPIFHMEAGNRCFDARVPEEINRKIVDHLSDVNLTISEQARDNLLREGLRPEFTFKIGSSMPEVISGLRQKIDRSCVVEGLGLRAGAYYLMSIHREENVTKPGYMETLLRFLENSELPVVFSAHPRFRKIFEESASDVARGNTVLCKPFGIVDYLALQMSAACVISDSGSLMEESDILSFPAVTIRDAHERPEAMETASVSVSSWNLDHIQQSVKIAQYRSTDAKQRPLSEGHMVKDYRFGDCVSLKVINLISSYTQQIKRKVWFD